MTLLKGLRIKRFETLDWRQVYLSYYLQICDQKYEVPTCILYSTNKSSTVVETGRQPKSLGEG